jgi:phospholipase C
VGSAPVHQRATPFRFARLRFGQAVDVAKRIRRSRLLDVDLLRRIESRSLVRAFGDGSRESGFPRVDPTLPAGADRLPQIRHVVVLMMENHSYDNYFGLLERGDGFPRDAAGRPRAMNPASDGRNIGAYHLATTEQIRALPNQSWESSHTQWNGGANDGFVRNVELLARELGVPPTTDVTDIGMGYWTDRDLPFYNALARTFPVADRWFASCLGPTIPNRRFLVAGTANGLATDHVGRTFDKPRAGTMFDLLSRHNISWTNYHAASGWRVALSRVFGLPGLRGRGTARLSPASERRLEVLVHELESNLQFTADAFPLSMVRHLLHIRPIKRFFRDASAGRLPAVTVVDPSFVDFSEENPQDIRRGERFAGTVIDAVMRGPGWPATCLIWLYDEHGGYFDHVAPPPAVEPDDVPPEVDDESARYDRYGFRVPAVIVSPYARPEFVLHDVHDHTSILRLIETKWNLPALTARDASANDLLAALDLVGPPAFAEPPALQRPALGLAAPPRYEF